MRRAESAERERGRWGERERGAGYRNSRLYHVTSLCDFSASAVKSYQRAALSNQPKTRSLRRVVVWGLPLNFTTGDGHTLGSWGHGPYGILWR